MLCKQKIKVLGTEYLLLIGDKNELQMSPENVGECYNYTKEIKVSTEELKEHKKSVGGMYRALLEVVIHELTHAFLYESGRTSDSCEEWIAEWLSVNFTKINEVVNDISDELSNVITKISDSIIGGSKNE